VKTILQIGALGVLLASAPAWASFSFVGSFTTVTATAPDSRPLAGQADFYYDSSANQLEVILTNTWTGASPVDSCTGICGNSQLLTGMDFKANGLTVTPGSANSASVTLYDATHNSWDTSTDPVTKTTTANSVVATAWQISNSGGFYHFDDTPLFAQPIANTSIQHNDGLTNGHTHEINQTTFILNVTGTLTSISDVSLNFGTGTDLVTTTPEPGFYGLLSLGLAGLFFVRRRRTA
jgi:hypothetical protein